MWIGGDEILGRAVDVGEIAAPATGNQDLLSRTLSAFQQGHSPTPLARLDCAHQTRGAGPQNQDVVSLGNGAIDHRKNIPRP